MVGSAILRRLQADGYTNLMYRRSYELDLRNQAAVNAFFEKVRPDYVFLAAAKVGGILANSTDKPAFMYDNTMIAMNVIHATYQYGVKKLLNLGSSCIYPKHAPQPLKEEYLLTGPLEETNDAYALAKIAAIKYCSYLNMKHGTNFISLMPTNLYGINDNYDLETSHVLPAMIRKFHEAKVNNTEVILWGDGSPKREFLFADDLADAALYLMCEKDASEIGEFVNVGTGEDISIKELAAMIKIIVGFEGNVYWDETKPNGTPRKLLDISKMHELGWVYKTVLKKGIQKTYEYFKGRNVEKNT